MAKQQVVWNGTSEEAIALLRSVQAHCECRHDDVRVISACAVHSMLVNDQRALNGLLFMRRMAAKLLIEEFDALSGRTV